MHFRGGITQHYRKQEDARLKTINLISNNMKKILILTSVSALLCSCGGGLSERPMGIIYANTADPIAATSSSGSRTGVATATSYLGLVALGDASIAAAKAQGGISTVSSVDVKRENILGVVSKYTTTVKGN